MENLYLKWKDYKTGKAYVIGALMRDKENNKYYFKLDSASVDIAKENGFNSAFIPFEIDKIYESDTIFDFFKIRLPRIDKLDEEDVAEMLEELQMKEYDEFEYFRKTKGELMTDDFILEEEK